MFCGNVSLYPLTLVCVYARYVGIARSLQEALGRESDRVAKVTARRPHTLVAIACFKERVAGRYRVSTVHNILQMPLLKTDQHRSVEMVGLASGVTGCGEDVSITKFLGIDMLATRHSATLFNPSRGSMRSDKPIIIADTHINGISKPFQV